ncbi:unnamed protein product [Effrenium voratum]|nr:unnamed protein product [Effrenium voratum]
MAKYLALGLCLLCRGDPCGSDDCDSLGLFQQRIHGSHKLQREGGLAPPSGPNAEVQATYAALTFALNESTDFVKDKLTQSPLIPKQAVSLGLGINMEIDHVMALNRPDLVFFDPVWTEAGLQVDVDIHNLHASGLLDVTAPQSKGHLNLTGGGHFRVSLSTAVSDGRLAVKVVQLVAQSLNVVPAIHLTCTSVDFLSAVPCAMIGALQGDVPGFIVDIIVFFAQSSIEEALKNVVESKLAENLATIPRKFPLQFGNRPSCLHLAFDLLGLTHLPHMKSAALQVQAVDACRGQSVASAPNSSVELAPPAQVYNTSMFSITLSGSVANDVLQIMHDTQLLQVTVFPKDIPADSTFGLDTNTLGWAFYCPWLATKYIWECPYWDPCPVAATIRSSSAPQVQMREGGVEMTIPLSVDFLLLDFAENETSTSLRNSTFLWRVNTTAHAVMLPKVASNRGAPCKQTFKATVDSLNATWFDVTETMEDSWVATALSINVFMPVLLSYPLEIMNEHLDEGVPIDAIGLGSSLYAFANSSLSPSADSILFNTDVLLAEDC